MPYKIRKLPKKNEYRVYNPETKEIHSYHTSLDNAEKQVRLLYMKHNEKISGKGSGASRESGAPRVPTNSELLADFPDDEFFNVNFEDDEFIDVRPTTPTIGSHRNEIVKQKVAELFERKNIDPEENKETEKLERRSIQAYALGIDLNPAEPYMKRDLQKYINRSKKYFENFMKNDPMDRFIYNSGEIPQHLRQRIERDHTEIMTSIGVFNINFLDPNHPIKAPDYNVADTIEPIILDIFNFKNELKKIKNPQLAPQQEIREAPQEEIREAEINGIGLPAGDLKELLSRSYNKKPSSFGDYKLDSQLSGQRGQVYYNEKMRKAVVVHRGTKGVQDMITDIRYTLGDKSGRRFKHAKNIQELANAKYGKENVITAGHSLGSVLGETAVRGKDQELITLNKPVGLADIGKTISKKQTDIKTERDPVSFLRGTQKGNAPLVIKSTSYNPLAEHSTETLGRVDESDIIGEGVSKTYLSNIYNMPKVSSTSEFVYIPQTKQQIFGTGMSAPKYGPHTGIVKQVHFKGVGVCCGRGIPAPPSRKIAVNL